MDNYTFTLPPIIGGNNRLTAEASFSRLLEINKYHPFSKIGTNSMSIFIFILIVKIDIFIFVLFYFIWRVFS